MQDNDGDLSFEERQKKEIEAFFSSMSERPVHRVISLDLIESLPDKDLIEAVYDIVWAAKQDLIELLSSLPQGYAPVYLTMLVESEVGNGGFNQMFHNLPMELVEAAIANYRAMNMPDIAELVTKAKQLHEKELPKKKSSWLKGTLKGFMESYKYSSLDEVDRALWEQASAIEGKRAAFIRSHAHDFVGDFRELYSS